MTKSRKRRRHLEGETFFAQMERLKRHCVYAQDDFPKTGLDCRTKMPAQQL